MIRNGNASCDVCLGPRGDAAHALCVECAHGLRTMLGHGRPRDVESDLPELRPTNDSDRLKERALAALRVCGPCDYGVPTGCTCPDTLPDDRWLISALLERVERLERAARAQA